ncbi:MAG: N-6 DNA methylase, partial [Prevotella sp.]|nr:N-6 DNA methylase [Prevotella sp.]
MRRIPVITKNLLIINIVAFIAMYLLRSIPLLGGNSNKLTDDNIENIIGCWAERKNKKHVAKLVTIDDVAE